MPLSQQTLRRSRRRKGSGKGAAAGCGLGRVDGGRGGRRCVLLTRNLTTKITDGGGQSGRGALKTGAARPKAEMSPPLLSPRIEK